MAVELFTNLGETTLASGYTSGGASITVTSASSFPTTGTFHVRLGNTGRTIYRVDSVSGAVFTGGAEFNDANASAGDTVKIVASREVAERFVESPESGESALRAGVAGIDEYGRYNWKMRRVPDTSGWTWSNQGSASVVQGSGLLKFVGHHVSGSTSIRGLHKAIPSTPFTITVGMIPRFPVATNLNNLAALGFGFFEVATTKHVCLLGANLDYSSGNATQGTIVVQGFTNPTTGGTLYVDHIAGAEFNSFGVNNLVPPFGGIVWLRAFDNGTDVAYTYSWDKVTWTTLITQTRITGFTTAPDRVGIFSQLQSATVTIADIGWFLSWEES
jgi:hypothetical protein